MSSVPRCTDQIEDVLMRACVMQAGEPIQQHRPPNAIMAPQDFTNRYARTPRFDPASAALDACSCIRGTSRDVRQHGLRHTPA